MKKLITLLLAVAGMVSTVSATVRIYIQPDSWADASAKLKVNLLNNGTFKSDLILGNSDLYKTGIYFLDIDENTINQFQLCRLNPSNDSQWNYSGNNSISGSAFYAMGAVSDGKTVTPSSYLPCNYYFLSGSGDSWALDATAEATNTNGVYTFSFSGATYANKRVTWVTGDGINADGTLISGFWNKVCKSKTTADKDDWITFANFSYDNVDLGNTGSAWYVPATDKDEYNDGQITITFNSSTKSTTITSSHTTTIASKPGYATYSNGGNYTVSGAEKIYVATGKGTNTIELTVMPSSTVFAANAGVILKGSGDVTINSVGSEEAYGGTNYLFGSGNKSKSVNDITNVYVFSWDGSTASSVGFYKAESTGSIAAHKAYLDVTGAASRFLSFSFADEATGISEATAQQNDNTIYNLQGVRMNQLSKGLNIVSGKKILVK